MKKPVVKFEDGADWACAIFEGTLYERESDVIQYLSSGDVADSSSAKVTCDVYQGKPYTYVVFRSDALRRGKK